MTSTRLLNIAGWSAYLSAYGIAIGLVPVILFVLGEDPFSAPLGKIHHIALFLSPLAALPVPLAIHSIYREEAGNLNSLAMVLGIVGILFPAGLVILGLLRLLMLTYISVVFTGVGVFALWLVLVGYLGFTRGRMQRGLAALGVGSGGSILLSVPLLWLMELLPAGHPVASLLSVSTSLGLLVGYLAYALWAIWLGGQLRSERFSVGVSETGVGLR